MENYQGLAIGQAIQALNIKITDVQRELAALRQDMRGLTFLLEGQRARTELTEQPNMEGAELESKTPA